MNHQFSYLQVASFGLQTYFSRLPNTAAVGEEIITVELLFSKEKGIGQEQALTQGIVRVGGM